MSQTAGAERGRAVPRSWRRRPPAEPTRRSTRRRRSLLREAVGTLVIAILVSLFIKTLLIQAFFIPSESMEPTLHGCKGCTSDRVIVNKTVTYVGGLHRGDIVVFHDSSGWLERTTATPGPQSRISNALAVIGFAPSSNERDLVKRIIGVGGDTVEGRDGKVYVNRVQLTEPYLFPGNRPSEIDFKVTVPPDKLWVMGDHRSESSDSRFHMTDPGKGFIPNEDVVGRAVVIVWPLDRIGSLS